MATRNEKQNVIIAYVYLFLVVFLWGVCPLFSKYLLEYFSPSMFSAIGCTISAISLLIICIPNLKQLNAKYFLTALPLGFFIGLASLLQKIGLQYTTPAKYSFLENLSCISVPILLFLFTKKKPNLLTIIASLLCLLATFLLSGITLSGDGATFKIGEILCALSGILYGVNIAGTGVFAKDLYTPLYIMIQMWVQAISLFIISFVLNSITVNGAPIQALKYTLDFKIIMALALLFLFSNTLCWILRTSAMKQISASVVAVITPVSAIITTTFSIIVGYDAISPSLIISAIIFVGASILSSVGDNKDRKKLLEN